MRVSRVTALLVTALHLAAAGIVSAERRQTLLLSDVSAETRAYGASTRMAEAGSTAPPSSLAVPPAATLTPTSPSPTTAPIPAKPVLYGIILGERGWIAYIEDPETRQVSAYRVGGTVA